MSKKPVSKSSILEEMKTIEEAIKPENLINSSNVILIDIDKIYEIALDNGVVMHNRISYSISEIKELAGNIKDLEPIGLLGTGLLQPIILRKTANEKLERISLPKTLLAQIGSDNEVVFSGNDHLIEIRRKEKFEARKMSQSEFVSLAEELLG